MPDPGPGLRLGLPAWAFPGWRGRWLDPWKPPLTAYAGVFNAVEGNTTFYRVPDARTVAAWRASVEHRDFRFAFKLPREVTHGRRPDGATLKRFLDALEPLGPWLGPLLVQFPARVGPEHLDHVAAVLDRIPGALERVVEVRHPDFFPEGEPDEGSPAQVLEAVLSARGCGRVCLDARPVHRTDPHHPEVAAAAHEKPDLPLRPEPLGPTAFVRLVLHPEARWNGTYLDEWALRCAAWLEAGHRVWMLVHCPNNLYCPEQAQAFHHRLGSILGPDRLPPPPDRPVPLQGRLL